MDKKQEQAIEAMNDGRNEDALAILSLAYQEIAADNPGSREKKFMTMFLWSELVPKFAPAHEALVALRDEQASLLLAGDAKFGETGQGLIDTTRFAVICDMNRTLGDSHSTYTVFVRLAERYPELARRAASRALPAIVAAKDYALAERYLPDPMRYIDDLNAMVLIQPIFAPPGQAPRLAAELSNFAQDLALKIATFAGLGREAEAQGLRTAALSALNSDEMRVLVERDIEAPGTILRHSVDAQSTT